MNLFSLRFLVRAHFIKNFEIYYILCIYIIKNMCIYIQDIYAIVYVLSTLFFQNIINSLTSEPHS